MVWARRNDHGAAKSQHVSILCFVYNFMVQKQNTAVHAHGNGLETNGTNFAQDAARNEPIGRGQTHVWPREMTMIPFCLARAPLYLETTWTVDLHAMLQFISLSFADINSYVRGFLFFSSKR